MREFLELLGTRIRTPIIANTIIAIAVWNWKPILLLLFGVEDFDDRIERFSEDISLWDYAVVPLGLGLFFSFLHPFIALLGFWLVRWPIQKRRLLQLDADSEYEGIKANYELLRRQRLASLEEEILAQAKRDEEISKIDDEEVREKYRQQLSEVRSHSNDRVGSLFTADVRKYLEIGRNLSDRSVRLLFALAESPSGKLETEETDGRMSLVVEGNKVMEGTDSITASAIREALKELWREDLIDDLPNSGSVQTRLTERGRAVFDAIMLDNNT